MPKKKSSSLLSSYRKRQRSSKTALTVVAALLILAGLVVIGLWATGRLGGGALPMFATKTPTATATMTPTPVTPTATFTITPTVTETPTNTPVPTLSGPFEYEVQEDDTCVSIAEKFDNANLEVLLALNNLDSGCFITIGQTILVPAPWQVMPTATPLPTDIRPGTVIDYRAEPGASFRSIAQFYYSTVTRILQESNRYRQQQGLPLWTENSQLQIGDLVKVPVNLVTPTPLPTATRTMTPSPTP